MASQSQETQIYVDEEDTNSTQTYSRKGSYNLRSQKSLTPSLNESHSSSNEAVNSDSSAVSSAPIMTKNSSSDSQKTIPNDEDEECSICIEPYLHPVRLPCTHVFCFLCLKGVTLTNGLECPLCRADIPSEFISKPSMVTPPVLTRTRSGRRVKRSSSNISCNNQASTSSSQSDESFQWFYEGKNGWWRYDERTNNELEEAFKGNCITPLTILIAGNNFTIDLNKMTQQRSDGCGMIRSIKRDRANSHAKGTAGLHTSTLIKGNKRRRKN